MKTIEIVRCPRCDQGWRGADACHCCRCARTYAGPDLFDEHRYRGRCLEPREIPGPRLIRRDGVWGSR